MCSTNPCFFHWYSCCSKLINMGSLFILGFSFPNLFSSVPSRTAVSKWEAFIVFLTLCISRCFSPITFCVSLLTEMTGHGSAKRTPAVFPDRYTVCVTLCVMQTCSQKPQREAGPIRLELPVRVELRKRGV